MFSLRFYFSCSTAVVFSLAPLGKQKRKKRLDVYSPFWCALFILMGDLFFYLFFFLSLLTRVFMIKLWVLWYAFYVFWRGLKGLLAYRACDFLACIYMDLVNLTIFEYIYPHR